MRIKSYINKFCLLVIIFNLAFGAWNLNLHADEIKQSYAAGNFYPNDTAELLVMLDNFFNAAEPAEVRGEIFALISPHAGYGYSGQTAANGYKLIKGKSYRTVIVIGSSHNYGFSGVSVYPEGKMRTPLGDLEIDAEFSRQLLGREQDIAFIPNAFGKEHSVEVQLPFLQKALDGFRIVPIVMGDVTLVDCQKLAVLLKKAIGSRRDVLVVASTDMYHGYSIKEADEFDARTIACLKTMDAEALYYGLRESRFQLCGGFGVVTTLMLSKELGHKRLDVLAHTNSAVVTQRKTDGEWTVGYVSCAIDTSTSLSVDLEQGRGVGASTDISIDPEQSRGAGVPETENGEKAMLNKKQRESLLGIARKSIETYLSTGRKMEVSETDPLLNKEMGAFVTLNKAGQLRGCIGNMVGRGPLYLTVRDMAVESATGDPRFRAVTQAELKNIEIEISVLSPLEKAASADAIILGKHGVIVKKDGNSGVFLPQVATETGWSKEEFLSTLCSQKAGLSPDAWKDPSTELYIFSAEVFSEKDY